MPGRTRTCELCGDSRVMMEMSFIHKGGKRIWLCHPYTSSNEKTCYVKVAVFGAKIPDAHAASSPPPA